MHRSLETPQEENMGKVLALMINLINKVVNMFDYASLIMCLDEIIYEGINTALDAYCISKGLK